MYNGEFIIVRKILSYSALLIAMLLINSCISKSPNPTPQTHLVDIKTDQDRQILNHLTNGKNPVKVGQLLLYGGYPKESITYMELIYEENPAIDGLRDALVEAHLTVAVEASTENFIDDDLHTFKHQHFLRVLELNPSEENAFQLIKPEIEWLETNKIPLPEESDPFYEMPSLDEVNMIIGQIPGWPDLNL